MESMIMQVKEKMGPRAPLVVTLMLIGIAIVTVCASCSRTDKDPSSEPEATVPQTNPVVTVEPTETVTAVAPTEPEAAVVSARQTPAPQPADSNVIIGRWVRTDAPYVIEIKGVNDDGTLQAAYYNPRQINVSRAKFQETGGNTWVFVELKDINYDGSNYTLMHDPEKDMMQGLYFQAAMKQNYDVTFRRQDSR